MRVKYSIDTIFMKQYDEYADYNDYSKGLIIDKIEFCNDDESVLEEVAEVEQVEQVEQVAEVAEQVDNKVYAEYVYNDLVNLSKTELNDILVNNNIRTKCINKTTKDSIIKDILNNKCKYDVEEQAKRNDAINKEKELLKQQKDNEKELLKQQKDKEKELLKQQKDNERELLKQQKDKEKELLKQQKDKENEIKKQQKQTELISKSIPNLVNENIIANVSTETALIPNTYYNPYFYVSYKIPKYLLSSNITFQKIKYDITNMFNENIKMFLNLNDVDYDDNKYYASFETNDDTYFIFNTIIIIKKHIIIPYGLKNINKYDYTDKKYNYSIKYHTDIYEEQYNLDKIKAIHNGISMYCFDIDNDNDKIIEMKSNDDNMIPKNILEKTETITEIIDRKMLCWITKNIEEVAKFCYQHKRIERGTGGISLEEYTNDIDEQVNTYYTYFTDFDNYEKNSITIHNRPALLFEKSRKYADKKYTKQVLPRPIRHMLSRKYYKDIDLSKAHFKIINNLIRTKDYIDADKCKCMISFIDNIDDSFKQFQNKFPLMSKSKIKMKLISLLFNDNIDYENHIFKEVPIFKDFLNDVIYLQEVLYQQEEYSNIIKNVELDIERKVENAIKYGNKTDDEIEKIQYNKQGKALARILQESENTILECILSYFKENGIVYGTLQYDGCEVMLPHAYKELGYKLPHRFFELGEKLLNDIEAYVKEKVDFDIKLCYKELDEGMEVNDTYIYSLERCYLLNNTNDNETSKHIINLIKHNIKKRKLNNNDYEILYYQNNKYVKGYDFVIKYIQDFIDYSNIYRFSTSKKIDLLNEQLKNNDYSYDIYKHHLSDFINFNINANANFRNSLAELIYGMLEPYVYDITDELNTSTINKWCFQNGVYDLTTKKFTKWGLETSNIYSTIIIERDFPDISTMSYERRNKLNKCMEFIENAIKNCYKEGNYDLYEERMRIISRVSGGNVVDKIWVLIIGYRNSWKTTEIDLITTAFGDYASTMGVSNLTMQGDNGDSAKRMYQFENCIDSRFLFVSEAKGTDDDGCNVKNKGVKMDSSIIKNISGGDLMFYRSMFGRKMVKFRPTFTLFHYCNNIPQYTNKDVLNNVMYIKTDFGFLPKNDPDFNKYTYKEPITYDGIDIKTILQNDKDYADAFVLLMIKYYQTEKIERSDKMYEDIKQIKQVSNQVSYNNVILEYVEPTDNDNDRIHKGFVENEMLDFIIDTYDDTFEPPLNKQTFRGILQKLKMEVSKGKLNKFGSGQHLYKFMKIKNTDLMKKYDEWVNKRLSKE